jgi:hypothetical protein
MGLINVAESIRDEFESRSGQSLDPIAGMDEII